MLCKNVWKCLERRICLSLLVLCPKRRMFNFVALVNSVMLMLSCSDILVKRSARSDVNKGQSRMKWFVFSCL